MFDNGVWGVGDGRLRRSLFLILLISAGIILVKCIMVSITKLDLVLGASFLSFVIDFISFITPFVSAYHKLIMSSSHISMR